MSRVLYTPTLEQLRALDEAAQAAGLSREQFVTAAVEAAVEKFNSSKVRKRRAAVDVSTERAPEGEE